MAVMFQDTTFGLEATGVPDAPLESVGVTDTATESLPVNLVVGRTALSLAATGFPFTVHA